MSDVRVKIIGQDWQHSKVGDVVSMRDVEARWMAALGRVEIVEDEPEPRTKRATTDAGLDTPEAPVTKQSQKRRKA